MILKSKRYIHYTYIKIWDSSGIYCIMQVCIPGLHLSLGIFNRLFSLLENACHELDLLQAEKIGGENTAGTSFGRYSAALRKMMEQKRLLDVTEQIIRDGSHLIAQLATRLADPETNPQLQMCQDWMLQQTRKAESLVLKDLLGSVCMHVKHHCMHM